MLGPIVAPGLRLLFVGINPSLRSAEAGHHFARPGNRFYPALYAAGLTPRLLRPDEDGLLPEFGLGVTNLAWRATRDAGQLSREELRAGAAELERDVARYAPRVVAMLGLQDEWWALVVVYPTFTIPFGTWLLMGFFKTVPMEMEEAARVDGCGYLGAFLRVVLPVSVPTL